VACFAFILGRASSEQLGHDTPHCRVTSRLTYRRFH